MNLVVHPSALSGRLTAPPSKSHMQRLVAAALLAEGESWSGPSDAATAGLRSVAAGLGPKSRWGPAPSSKADSTRAPTPSKSGKLGIRMFSSIAALHNARDPRRRRNAPGRPSTWWPTPDKPGWTSNW